LFSITMRGYYTPATLAERVSESDH
jgi:hypothetical protein